MQVLISICSLSPASLLHLANVLPRATDGMPTVPALLLVQSCSMSSWPPSVAHYLTSSTRTTSSCIGRAAKAAACTTNWRGRGYGIGASSERGVMTWHNTGTQLSLAARPLARDAGTGEFRARAADKGGRPVRANAWRRSQGLCLSERPVAQERSEEAELLRGWGRRCWAERSTRRGLWPAGDEHGWRWRGDEGRRRRHDQRCAICQLEGDGRGKAGGGKKELK